MAIRKRTIQPSIWQDPDFGTLSPLAQLIFIGCITQADDEGRLNGHPAVIKSSLFPYETMTLEQIFDGLQEIINKVMNFIYYSVDGQFYIQLKNWGKHQILREDRLIKSTFPQPPKDIVAGRCRASDRQVGAEVSKEVSKEVRPPQAAAVIKILDGLRSDLEAKGILKNTKLL
ncbi:MAG: hypothetical protein UV20_C0009G0053 [Candidatus Magasanikbacteria bacterium GW2011_GWA2_42_32]|uniref:Uncharacterized protein n=1 Tax=Candidatus Magasanikbacteria bacterium GW2011_GWA2_42_32 TaxID=1619039 RepID=A0A0G1A6J3_9BACT|nr:MAG: hypothetical protein UV20_C0009G0053 [Candidatus Magasanikbacteria bacterium GW2011_GWA2_42_32]HBX15871.1 hypothetical protein [Candidatus Magasanikbacteria bacterium]